MKIFMWEIRNFGLKVALDDMLLSFVKWFLKAKKVTITYKDEA